MRRRGRSWTGKPGIQASIKVRNPNRASPPESQIPTWLCPPADLPDPPLLGRHDELAAPILLPAGFGVLAADRLFLALADHGDPVGRNTKADQVVLDRRRRGACRARGCIRSCRASRMAFDGHLRARPPLHPVGITLQKRPRVVANRRLVEIEVAVASGCSRVQLVERLPREDLLFGQRAGAGAGPAVAAAVAAAAAAAPEQPAAVAAARAPAVELSYRSRRRQQRTQRRTQRNYRQMNLTRVIVTLLVENRSLQSYCQVSIATNITMPRWTIC